MVNHIGYAPHGGGEVALDLQLAPLGAAKRNRKVGVMTRWVAISYGALDCTGVEGFVEGTEIVLLPVIPTGPIAIKGEAAALWVSLIGGREGLSFAPEERSLLEEFREFGIASESPHPYELSSLKKPWFISPLHELVCALVACVAKQNSIDVAFIKGPMQHAQGLREREHSGDVDVWVRHEDRARLATAMERWGWTPVTGLFTGSLVGHSQTLLPSEWGCSIDVHTRFPGITVSDDDAFQQLLRRSETWEFAGRQSLAPEKSMSAVLRALHDLRPRSGDSSPTPETPIALQALHVAGEDTIQVAEELGALGVLGATLKLTFPDIDIDMRDATIPQEWDYLSASTKAKKYWVGLTKLPWRKRPRALFRLIWPNRKSALAYSEAHGRQSKKAIAARFQRIGDGMREIFRKQP